nr:MAG: hypothetical protein [Microviridae sp.]
MFHKRKGGYHPGYHQRHVHKRSRRSGHRVSSYGSSRGGIRL